MTDSKTAGRIYTGEVPSDPTERKNLVDIQRDIRLGVTIPTKDTIYRTVNGLKLTYDECVQYEENWAEHLADLGFLPMEDAPTHREFVCRLIDGSDEILHWDGAMQCYRDRMGGCYDDNGTVGWRELKDYTPDTWEEGRE
jgi:hypothetical protein